MKKWSWSASENDVALQQLKLLRTQPRPTPAVAAERFYALPTTLAEALAWRAAQPEALVVAGATDVGLWITKQQRRFTRILDIGRVAELRRLARRDGWLSVGAAVHADRGLRRAGRGPTPVGVLLRALCRPAGARQRHPRRQRRQRLADWRQHAAADCPGRAAGAGQRPRPARAGHRGLLPRLPPDRAGAGRIAAVHRGAAAAPRRMAAADKISKRREDDISAVCLAIWLEVADGVVRAARVGAGGVAPVPARARRTEAALLGQPWRWRHLRGRGAGAWRRVRAPQRHARQQRLPAPGAGPAAAAPAHAQRQAGLALDTLAPIAVAPEPRT
jgi:xanthine dehydrogenase small subunit